MINRYYDVNIRQYYSLQICQTCGIESDWEMQWKINTAFVSQLYRQCVKCKKYHSSSIQHGMCQTCDAYTDWQFLGFFTPQIIRQCVRCKQEHSPLDPRENWSRLIR